MTHAKKRYGASWDGKARADVAPEAGGQRTSFRWVICALLFCATAINYMDRQIIGILKPSLQHELGWSEEGYGTIVFWFQATYAVGYLSFGRIVDRIGAKVGFACAMVLWTIAHVAHALVRSVTGFCVVRAALGFGEGGNFPGAVKAIAEWFPKQERALAFGISIAGANVGAIATPLLVPAIALIWGWRAAFVITSSFSLVWLIAWLAIYRQPAQSRRVSPSELKFITSDPPDDPGRVYWRDVIFRRETLAYAMAKFLVDPVWWMFLFWLPDFFAKRHGLNLQTFGVPLAIIYVTSDLGSVAGGYVSSRLIKRGVSLNASRKLTMALCALLIVPVITAATIDNLWFAVAVLSLATAAHQGFSANLLTLPSDLFPRKAVGTVAGIGGAMGAVGGMIMAEYAGYILQTVGSYTPIFAACGALYFIALLVIQLLSPRMTPVSDI
jgi:ACS family hexuronate transporter-like MFS transporter